MKDFPRPRSVKVSIFGETHELHRLTRRDVAELLEEIMDQFAGEVAGLTGPGLAQADAIRLAIRSGGPALGFLLAKSFPSFKEWEELPLSHEVGLFDLVWDENDIPGIIEDFFGLMEKGKKLNLLTRS